MSIIFSLDELKVGNRYYLFHTDNLKAAANTSLPVKIIEITEKSVFLVRLDNCPFIDPYNGVVNSLEFLKENYIKTWYLS